MGTGFKGRTGIYELLLVNSHIKHAILQGKDAGQLNEIALEHNFQTLKDYGVKKIIDGVTTIDEVLRVT